MSIFDLNTSGELPAVNQGIGKYRYEKVSAIRGLAGTSFPNGPIRFRFTISGEQWFVPAQSYIRMRALMSQGDDSQLLNIDGLSPAMGLVANLFQSGAMKLQEKVLSPIVDNFSRIDSLNTRMTKPKAWLDGVGAQLNFWNPYFTERMEQITDDAPPAKTSTGKEELGYANTATYGIGASTDIGDEVVVTFIKTVADVGPDLDDGDAFRPGDYFLAEGIKYKVVNILTALTMTVIAPSILGATGALGTAFWRIRGEDKPRTIGVELIWTPPFSVNKLSHGLPVGDYELLLQPQNANRYQELAFESIDTNVAGTGAGDLKFSVVDMFYYRATMIGPRVTDGSYFLDLDEINCQRRTITMAGTQEDFTVSKKTYALSVAFQSQLAGTSPVYPTSRFVMRRHAEQRITDFQIDYASERKPSPRPTLDHADNRLDTGIATFSKNYLVQRYMDTYTYNGLLFDPSGPESYADWLERGFYFYMPFPKDADDDSTRVIVRYAFDSTLVGGGVTAGNAPTPQMLLFNHYKSMAEIKVEGGRVVDVLVQER